jgi:hypothetical protein
VHPADLPVMDVEVAGSLTDPYLCIQTDPPTLLLNKRPLKTKTMTRNLNPE